MSRACFGAVVNVASSGSDVTLASSRSSSSTSTPTSPPGVRQSRRTLPVRSVSGVSTGPAMRLPLAHCLDQPRRDIAPQRHLSGDATHASTLGQSEARCTVSRLTAQDEDLTRRVYAYFIFRLRQPGEAERLTRLSFERIWEQARLSREVEQEPDLPTFAAARAVIARDGLDAASVRRVAAEAGSSTTVVTHYFADKQALLVAAVEDAYAAVAARMATHVRGGPGGVATLRAVASL